MGHIVKTFACIRRRPDLTIDEFEKYWLENHARVIQSVAGTMKMRRYVQCHLLRGDLTDLFSTSRNGIAPFDGVAEVWFDEDDLTGEMTHAQLEANMAMLEDERAFIDVENSAFFFAVEHEFFAEGS